MMRTLLAALFAAAAISSACAQGNYPNKPIRWIIPYASGGGTDVIARPLALRLGDVLGVPIVYENRGGGGGLIAGETVARSAPDGYTLLVGSGNTHTFPTLLYDKVPYDPVRDYAPITNFVIAPNVLVAHPSFPPKTIRNWLRTARPIPGRSTGHLRATAPVAIWHWSCSPRRSASRCCTCHSRVQVPP